MVALAACGSPASRGLRLEPGTVAIHAHDGTQLLTRHWGPSTPPRGVLVIVHGLKDYSARYAAMGERLAAAGYSVYAFDLRGHGRSDGARVYPDRWLDYVNDLRTVLHDVARAVPGVPVFVFGHSMGGAIATLTAELPGAQLAGLITSGAALAIAKPPLAIGVTRTIGALLPGAALLELPNAEFSSDPAAAKTMDKDPLVEQDKVPARTAAGLIGGIHLIWSGVDQLTLPMLVLHGGADTVTPPAGSRMLVAAAPSADKALHIYPGLAHDLVHEPQGTQVVDDIQAWLDAHTGGPAVVAPAPYQGELAGDPGGWTQAVQLGAGLGETGDRVAHATGELAVNLAWPGPIGFHGALTARAVGELWSIALRPIGVAYHREGYALGISGGGVLATGTHAGLSGGVWGELPAGPLHLGALAELSRVNGANVGWLGGSIRLGDVAYWPHAVGGVGPVISAGYAWAAGDVHAWTITFGLALLGAN